MPWFPYPGTNNFGTLASLQTVDGSVFRMTTERDPAYGQRAAYRLRFTDVSPQGATIQINQRADVSTTATFLYAYNWTTETYEYVAAVTPATTLKAQTISLTSDQLAKYLDASGNLYVIFRINQPARLGNAPFTWDTDAVSLVSAPVAPSSLTATGDPSITKIDLAWTDNATDETGFRVERQNPGNTAWTTVANLGANVTVWTNTGLAANATYSYRVAALNAAGLSGYSNVASAATLQSGDNNAPGYTAVYATGSHSMRVYWETVAGASAYKIYRATSPGAYNFSAPIATVQATTGTEHIFDDQGLTENQDYFYVVRAVVSGVESSASPEDSHYPNAGAIPWNGTSAQIVSAVNSDAYGDPDLPYTVPYGNTDVMSPDGRVYVEETATVSSTEATVDEVDWKTIINSQEIPLGSFEWPKPKPKTNGGTPTPARKESGGMRRVISPLGYDGVSAWVTIPRWQSGAFTVQENNTSYSESAFAYIGASGNTFQVDAGLAYEKAVPGLNLPRRWTPIIKIKDGDTRAPGRPFPVNISGRALVKATGRAYVNAESIIGNDVCIAYFVSPRTRMCRLYVFAVDSNGLYVARKLCAAVKLPSKSGQPVQNLRMKRVISLAQSAPANLISPFSNPVDLSVWPGTSTGYVRNGSILSGVFFKRARLYNSGQPTIWTSSLNAGRGAGDNYTSKPPTTVSGDQSTGGADTGGTGERCDIVNN